MKLVRFDKQVMSQLAHLKSAFGSDDSIVLHTLLFVAYDLQYNVCQETLFGLRVWDPYTIASSLGFSAKTLVNKLPQSQRRELALIPASEWETYIASKGKRPLWDTQLDNAIFLLLEQSRVAVVDVNKGADLGSSLRKLNVFDSATKYFRPRNKKIYYEVAYSEPFMAASARYFSRFDLDLLVALPPACRVLYLSLMNLRDSATSHTATPLSDITLRPSYESLAAWANTGQAKRSWNSAAIREKLDLINAAAKRLSKREPPGDYLTYSAIATSPTIQVCYSSEEIEQIKLERHDRVITMTSILLKTLYRKLHWGLIQSMSSREEFYHSFKQWLESNESYEQKLETWQEARSMMGYPDERSRAKSEAMFLQVLASLSKAVAPEQFVSSLS
ncbi:MAG: hypothetical protein IM613_16950 [Cytophagales bacterium]|nr:hypothetical protein [Cytophagales bacterium]